MGRTTLIEHTIDTGTHRPIRQAMRRHPRAHLDEIDNQVEGLLENGLIEPAASPWASNVVLVKRRTALFGYVSIIDGSTLLPTKTLICFLTLTLVLVP